MASDKRISAIASGEGGTPVSTEILPDGGRRHTLANGEVYEEDGPNFRLEYKSIFPGDTYTRDIAIFGLAERKHLFEAWCYVYNALRTYAFSKVVALEELATGKRYSGEELREVMGGELPPSLLVEQSPGLEAAWAATAGTFVVADLETTGLDAGTDEILELAAVKVGSTGSVLGEFAMLVRPSQPVPSFITQLTSISQADVDREGRSLADAMAEFLAFVETHPVFFHNAPFDSGFLQNACTATKLQFNNPVHDTLPMTRQAWPSLGTHKLAALADYIAVPTPSHRALSDARTTLAVLLAAKRAVSTSPTR